MASPRRPRPCPARGARVGDRGSGGVGALAVQLAAHLGAEVTATVRSDVVELVRNLGARKVIDVRTAAVDEATWRTTW